MAAVRYIMTYDERAESYLSIPSKFPYIRIPSTWHVLKSQVLNLWDHM